MVIHEAHHLDHHLGWYKVDDPNDVLFRACPMSHVNCTHLSSGDVSPLILSVQDQGNMAGLAANQLDFNWVL